MSIVDKKGLACVKTRGSLRATKISLRVRLMKCCRKSKASPAVLSAHLGQRGERHALHVTAYVALAEALEAPLVTRDARRAQAPSNRATVELYQ